MRIGGQWPSACVGGSGEPVGAMRPGRMTYKGIETGSRFGWGASGRRNGAEKLYEGEGD